MVGPDRARLPRGLVVAAAVATAAIAVRLCWVGDDAFITLRTVENLVAGHGPVWNVGERVQAYTHPLWLLLLSCARVLTGDAYAAVVSLSLVLTVATVVLATRAADTSLGAATVALVLLLSRSFTEYAVSGLENPLAFLLLVLFVRAARGEGEPAVSTRRTAFLAGLLALTRLDLGLLCAPVLLAGLRGERAATWLGRTALGLAPLLGWLLFAAFYYGSPLPITAYAKATHHDLPTGALLLQGLRHVRWVAAHDPLTLVVTLAGIALGLARREAGARALALGALLYVGYVVAIGGDFMGGRFYTPPFVVALLILARGLARAPVRVAAPAWSGAVVLALVPGLPAWTRPPSSDVPHATVDGITDERAVHASRYGLLGTERAIPRAGVLTETLRRMGRTEPVFSAHAAAGRIGFEGGELLHVIDPWLLDPLLMRLPAGSPDHWRIGHFPRHLPEGYLETLATGENRIHHPGLARYHDTLSTVIGTDVPLLAGERLRALWRLWSGALDDDLAAYVAEDYRTPPGTIVAAADLARELPPSAIGTGPLWFDDPRGRIVYRGGLEVRFETPTAVHALQLQLAGGNFVVYRLRFLRAGEPVAEFRVDATARPAAAGLGPFRVTVPPDAGPIDAVLVDAPGAPPHAIAVLGSLRVE